MSCSLEDKIKSFEKEFKLVWNMKKNLQLEEERTFYQQFNKFCTNNSDESVEHRQKLYQSHVKMINEGEEEFSKFVIALVNSTFRIQDKIKTFEKAFKIIWTSKRDFHLDQEKIFYQQSRRCNEFCTNDENRDKLFVRHLAMINKVEQEFPKFVMELVNETFCNQDNTMSDEATSNIINNNISLNYNQNIISMDECVDNENELLHIQTAKNNHDVSEHCINLTINQHPRFDNNANIDQDFQMSIIDDNDGNKNRMNKLSNTGNALFVVPDQFINHKPIMIRSGNKKRYQCDYTGCRYSSDIKSHLRKHIDCVHKQIKKYQCKYCNKKFGQKGTLKVHVDTVHEKIRRYHCNYCEKKFGLNSDLKRHIDAVHKKDKEISMQFV